MRTLQKVTSTSCRQSQISPAIPLGLKSWITLMTNTRPISIWLWFGVLSNSFGNVSKQHCPQKSSKPFGTTPVLSTTQTTTFRARISTCSGYANFGPPKSKAGKPAFPCSSLLFFGRVLLDIKRIRRQTRLVHRGIVRRIPRWYCGKNWLGSVRVVISGKALWTGYNLPVRFLLVANSPIPINVLTVPFS